MVSKEEEAKIAMDTAEKKLSENDYNGAKINGEADWYGILGVDPLADDEAVKKQYKKLALLLHPDKNRFNGAEGAFKLVLQAWDLLSDKDKRAAYDRKRKRKRSRMQDPPKPHEYESRYKSDPEPEQPDPDSSWEQENPRKPEEFIFFWTVCKNKRCNTHCKFVKSRRYLNKTLCCPNCRQCFVATEIIPEMVDGRPVYRFSAKFQRTSESTSDDASSSNTSDSDSANQAEEKILPATSARGDEKEA
ncbi:PREDICTED: uncharacterized protein LOC104718358 isoform X2 [Camelina sativa]|uniref:Uncharacterized protein LOC104718358 isoform X2 n=1 Tax=Camelina sativa TaxID=90675 RepID=A0ABM0U1B7_CAMSA|nr:PREDICTED: uncharacterized protein LOC104718358 isoform X2 [Camelina sativa]